MRHIEQMRTSAARVLVICAAATLLAAFPEGSQAAAEKGPRCTDGQDNDGDGQIDCADPDCKCTIGGDDPSQIEACITFRDHGDDVIQSDASVSSTNTYCHKADGNVVVGDIGGRHVFDSGFRDSRPEDRLGYLSLRAGEGGNCDASVGALPFTDFEGLTDIMLISREEYACQASGGCNCSAASYAACDSANFTPLSTEFDFFDMEAGDVAFAGFWLNFDAPDLNPARLVFNDDEVILPCAGAKPVIVTCKSDVGSFCTAWSYEGDKACLYESTHKSGNNPTLRAICDATFQADPLEPK